MLLAPAILVQMIVVGLNLLVDPLWTLPVVASRPFAYCVNDERVNKVNRMVHGRAKWDGVLVGNSRASFIDPTFFQTARVMNLAVNGMRVSEYIDYLKIFVRYNGVPRVAFIAFDFISQPGGGDPEAIAAASKKALEIELESIAPLYRLEKTLDWSTAMYAARVILECDRPDYRHATHRYDGAERIRRQTYDAAHDAAVLDQAESFVRSTMLDTVFHPDQHFRERIRSLKAIMPGTQIVPVVLPITTRLFVNKMSAGRLEDYLSWLDELVAEFGEVRYFAGFNSFTEDLHNFYDGHHVYSDLTREIVDIVEGGKPPHADGFGRVLTGDNLAAFKASLREEVCGTVRPRIETPDFVRGCPDAKPLEGLKQEIYALSPAAKNWTVATKSTRASVDEAGVTIDSDPGLSTYQLMSPVIKVQPGRTYKVEASISVAAGGMSLGALDYEAGRWIALIPVEVAQSWTFIAPHSQVQLVLALRNQSPVLSRATVSKLRLLGD
jgi:hypothetical protein